MPPNLHTAAAFAGGTVSLGTLSASLAASASFSGSGNGGDSAGSVVNETWRDSFIALGPPGTLLTYRVTFLPSASITTDSDFDHCGFGIPFASISASLIGAVNFAQSVTDCSPAGAGSHSETAMLSLFAGGLVGFEG